MDFLQLFLNSGVIEYLPLSLCVCVGGGRYEVWGYVFSTFIEIFPPPNCIMPDQKKGAAGLTNDRAYPQGPTLPKILSWLYPSKSYSHPLGL